MFNGYNETPLISYEFDQEREKKQDNVCKWLYGGHDPGLQPTQPHPNNRQSEFWSGKPNFLGISNAVNFSSKCNCSGCYSSSENQSYQGEPTRHRPWLPRSFSVSLNGSADPCKLPGYHQWDDVNASNQNSCFMEGNVSTPQFLQESGGKQSHYRQYANLRLTESNQPGVITSVKNSDPAKKDFLLKQKDEILIGQDMIFHGQNGTRQPMLCNPAYNLSRQIEKRPDGRNFASNFCDSSEKYSSMDSFKHSANTNSYSVDQHMSRLPVVEPYIKAVPSHLNPNVVPSTGHRSVKENMSQSYIDQSYIDSRKLICSESNLVINGDKTPKMVYQTAMGKEGSTPENISSGQLHNISNSSMDLKHNGISGDHRSFNAANMSLPCGSLSESDTQKSVFENTRHPDFFPKNMPDLIKRNNQNMTDNRKDCAVGQMNVGDQRYGDLSRYNHMSNIPKFSGLVNAKNSCGIFYQKEFGDEKMFRLEKFEQFPENPACFQRNVDAIKSENVNAHPRLPRPELIFNDPKDPRYSDRLQNSMPYQNNPPNYRNFMRSEYSHQGHNAQGRYEYSHGMTSFQRNDLNQYNQHEMQQQMPNCGPDQFMPQANNSFIYNAHYQQSGNQDKILPQQFYSNKSQSSNSVQIYSSISQNQFEEPRDRFSEGNKNNYLETIRSEEINKSGNSKISPLRLLRKKKFINPRSENIAESNFTEPGTLSAANALDTQPALDVRKFWSTWADEEEENVLPTQMIVLDCQNIDPEQAKLLQLYESEPVRAVHFESGNVVALKGSESGRDFSEQPSQLSTSLQETKSSFDHFSNLNEVKNEQTICKQVCENQVEVIQQEESFVTRKSTDNNSLVTSPDVPSETSNNFKGNNQQSITKPVMSESSHKMSNESTPPKTDSKPCKRGRSAASQDNKETIRNKKVILNKKTEEPSRLDKWTEKKFDFLKRAEESKAAEILRYEEEKKKIFKRRLSFHQGSLINELKKGNVKIGHKSEVEENPLLKKQKSEKEYEAVEKRIGDEKVPGRLSPFDENSRSNSLDGDQIEEPDLPTSEYRRNKFLDYSDQKILENDLTRKESTGGKVTSKQIDSKVVENDISNDLPVSNLENIKKENNVKLECPAKTNWSLLEKCSSNKLSKNELNSLLETTVINNLKIKEETALPSLEMEDILKKISEINFQNAEVKLENDKMKEKLRNEIKSVNPRRIKISPSKRNKKSKKITMEEEKDEKSDKLTVENISVSKPTIKFSIQKSHDLKISFKVLNSSKKYENSGSDGETGKEKTQSDENPTDNSKSSTELITLKLKSFQRDISNGDKSLRSNKKMRRDGSTSKKDKRRFRRKKIREEESEGKTPVLKIKKNRYMMEKEEKDPLADETDSENLSAKQQTDDQSTSDDFQVQETVDSAKIKLTFKRHKANYEANCKINQCMGGTDKDLDTEVSDWETNQQKTLDEEENGGIFEEASGESFKSDQDTTEIISDLDNASENIFKKDRPDYTPEEEIPCFDSYAEEENCNFKCENLVLTPGVSPKSPSESLFTSTNETESILIEKSDKFYGEPREDASYTNDRSTNESIEVFTDSNLSEDYLVNTQSPKESEIDTSFCGNEEENTKSEVDVGRELPDDAILDNCSPESFEKDNLFLDEIKINREKISVDFNKNLSAKETGSKLCQNKLKTKNGVSIGEILNETECKSLTGEENSENNEAVPDEEKFYCEDGEDSKSLEENVGSCEDDSCQAAKEKEEKNFRRISDLAPNSVESSIADATILSNASDNPVESVTTAVLQNKEIEPVLIDSREDNNKNLEGTLSLSDKSESPASDDKPKVISGRDENQINAEKDVSENVLQEQFLEIDENKPQNEEKTENQIREHELKTSTCKKTDMEISTSLSCQTSEKNLTEIVEIPEVGESSGQVSEKPIIDLSFNHAESCDIKETSQLDRKEDGSKSDSEIEDGEIIDDTSEDSEVFSPEPKEKSKLENTKIQTLQKGTEKEETEKLENVLMSENKIVNAIKNCSRDLKKFDSKKRISRRHSLNENSLTEIKFYKIRESQNGLQCKKIEVSRWHTRSKSCPPAVKFSKEKETPVLDIPVEDIPLPPGNPLPENCFDFSRYFKSKKVKTETKSVGTEMDLIQNHKEKPQQLIPSLQLMETTKSPSNASRKILKSDSFSPLEFISSPDPKNCPDSSKPQKDEESKNFKFPGLQRNFKIKFSIAKRQNLKSLMSELNDKNSDRGKIEKHCPNFKETTSKFLKTSSKIIKAKEEKSGPETKITLNESETKNEDKTESEKTESAILNFTEINGEDKKPVTKCEKIETDRINSGEVLSGIREKITEVDVDMKTEIKNVAEEKVENLPLKNGMLGFIDKQPVVEDTKCDGVKDQGKLLKENLDIMGFELNDIESENVEVCDSEPMTDVDFEGNNDCMGGEFYECEDIPTSEDLPTGDDDIEVEKVSDDDKFRNIMQNCLDNAKKFLNVGNLKLFSCSVDDLLEIDCQLPDSTTDENDLEKPAPDSANHFSRDVLLTSCEDITTDDLGLSEKFHLTDITMDFVPSFASDGAHSLCPEILPVDNWPYLEEEVPSSPSVSKAEENDLLPSLENITGESENLPDDTEQILPHVSGDLKPRINKLSRDRARKMFLPGVDSGNFKRVRRKSCMTDDETFRKCSPFSNQRRNTIDGFTENILPQSEHIEKNQENKCDFKILKNGLENFEKLLPNDKSLKCRLSLEKLAKKNGFEDRNNTRFDVCGKSLEITQKADNGILMPSKLTAGPGGPFRKFKGIVRKRKTSGNYKSSYWQPKVVLIRISKNELRKVYRKSSFISHKFRKQKSEVTLKEAVEKRNMIVKSILENNDLNDVSSPPTAKKQKFSPYSESIASNNSTNVSKLSKLYEQNYGKVSFDENSKTDSEEFDLEKVQNDINKNSLYVTEALLHPQVNTTKQSPFGLMYKEEMDEVKRSFGSDITTSEGTKRKKSRFRNLHSKKKSEHDGTRNAKDNGSPAQDIIPKVSTLVNPEKVLREIFKDCDSPKERVLHSQAKSTKGSIDVKVRKEEDKIRKKLDDEQNLATQEKKVTNSNVLPEGTHGKVKTSSSIKKEGEKMHSHKEEKVRSNGETSHGHREAHDKSRNKHGNQRDRNESYHKYKERHRDEGRKEGLSKHRHGTSRERKNSRSKDQTPERKKTEENTPKKFTSSEEVAKIRDDDCEDSWVCEVCGFNCASERVAHIKNHPFHCQSCHLAFKTETHFVDHLTKKHKDIRNQHHCLLCELSFDTEDQYQKHLDTREHKHLESVEKNTINTLFTLLTGQPCPVLGLVEMKPEWLPNQAGTVHFYHQATPLSLALQYLKMHHDLTSYSTVSSAHPN